MLDVPLVLHLIVGCLFTVLINSCMGTCTYISSNNILGLESANSVQSATIWLLPTFAYQSKVLEADKSLIDFCYVIPGYDYHKLKLPIHWLLSHVDSLLTTGDSDQWKWTMYCIWKGESALHFQCMVTDCDAHFCTSAYKCNVVFGFQNRCYTYLWCSFYYYPDFRMS